MSSIKIWPGAVLTILFFSFFTTSFAQSKKLAYKAKNYTPLQIWEDIEWMKKVRVSGIGGMGSEDDQYFVQYTKPSLGILHFRDGRIVTGKLQVYKRYNKSNTDVDRKFIMVIDGKRKVYTGWDIEYYYYSFTPNDLKGKVWRMGTKISLSGGEPSTYNTYKSQNAKHPAEVFAKGTLTLSNGSSLDGLVAFDYAKEYAGELMYSYVYVAKDKSSPVTLYTGREANKVVKSVDGKMYHFQTLKGGMIELEQWVTDLENTKLDDTDVLSSGIVQLDNGVEQKGFIALNKVRNPTYAFFLNEDKSEITYYNRYSKVQAISIDVYETTYSFTGDRYMSMENIQKALDKSSGKRNVEEKYTLVPGSMTLTSGKIIKGKIAQQEVKSSSLYLMGDNKGGAGARTIRGGIFFQGNDGKLKVYTRKSVKVFNQLLSTGKEDFIVVTIESGAASMSRSVGYAIWGVTKLKASMPYNGYVKIDGKKIESKVKITNSNVWYREDGEIKVKPPRAVEEVFIDKPNDPLMYFGGDYFVRIYYPFKAISYYKNPYPVFCNEKASARRANFMQLTKEVSAFSAAAVATAQAQRGEITAAQERNVKKNLYDWYTDDSNTGTCLVYYDEYVLRFNSTGEQLIVYRENIKSVVRSLILGCEGNEKLNKTIRNFDKIKDIDEMIRYVNESRCIVEGFKNMESAPISMFKFDPFSAFDAVNILRVSSNKDPLPESAQYLDNKKFKGELTPWYYGWIQTLGGAKVEGLIQLARDETSQKPSKSSFLNRANLDVLGVTIRVREKRKAFTLTWEYYIPRDYVRAIGVKITGGNIKGQFEQFTDVEAYEPNMESFLEEEIKVFNPNGSIENKEGTVMEGKLTIKLKKDQWFGVSVVLEDEDGESMTFTAKDNIKYVKIREAGVEKTYIPFRGALTDLIYDNGNYRYFRNPYPESTVVFASAFATTIKSAQEASGGSSLDLSSNDSAINFYRMEFVFLNTDSGEEIIVNSKNYKRMLAAYLAFCPSFTDMDKETKKQYLDYKSPKKTIEALTKCY